MLSEIDDLRRELDDLRKRYASLEAEKKELELRFEKEYQKWKRFKKWVLVGGSIKAGTTELNKNVAGMHADIKEIQMQVELLQWVSFPLLISS